MRKGIIVDVTAADRARLRAVVTNLNSPQKHVWRAKIILLTADGLGTNAIMRGAGRAKSVEDALGSCSMTTRPDAVSRASDHRSPFGALR